MELTSLGIGRAALAMAISKDRQEEQALRLALAQNEIRAVAVDFGGEYLQIVKKIIERAVVAAQRQGVVKTNHAGEGAVAGAAHAALEAIATRAVGLNVGGKIGIARGGEHLSVAIYAGIGLLNLDEMAVGMAHRSLSADD